MGFQYDELSIKPYFPALYPSTAPNPFYTRVLFPHHKFVKPLARFQPQTLTLNAMSEQRDSPVYLSVNLDANIATLSWFSDEGDNVMHPQLYNGTIIAKMCSTPSSLPSESNTNFNIKHSASSMTNRDYWVNIGASGRVFTFAWGPRDSSMGHSSLMIHFKERPPHFIGKGDLKMENVYFFPQ